MIRDRLAWFSGHVLPKQPRRAGILERSENLVRAGESEIEREGFEYGEVGCPAVGYLALTEIIVLTVNDDI
jgi:hypothetical protein